MLTACTVEPVGNAIVVDPVNKTLRIPHTAFVPTTEGTTFTIGTDGLTPGSAGSGGIYYAAVTLPQGVIINSISARLHQVDSSDAATVRLYRMNGSSAVGLAEAIYNDGDTGWQTIADALDTPEVVDDDYAYTVQAELVNGASNVAGGRVLWVDVLYTSSNYRQTL